MLRPHKNNDLHCAHREHKKVRLIDSFISSFENSLLLKSLDLINNRKKKKNDNIAVIRKSKQGHVVFYVRFLIINLLGSSRAWLVLCLYILLFWFKLYTLSISSALCVQMLKLVC